MRPSLTVNRRGAGPSLFREAAPTRPAPSLGQALWIGTAILLAATLAIPAFS